MRYFFGKIADYIRECEKITLVLCIITSMYGCIAVLSATRYTGSVRQFLTQVIATFLGLVVAVGISLYDYNKLVKRWYIPAIVGLIPVILTFFFGTGPQGTDDKAWLILPGNVSFQPSELLKISFIITFAAHIAKVQDKISKLKTFLVLCVHGAIPVVLIHFQGDDGTAMVFAIMFTCMLFASGVRIKHLAISAAGVLGMTPLVFFFVMSDQQRQRIMQMFDLESDLLGGGWQQWRGRIALANGGIFGQGLFKGTLTQTANVPKGYNDFIFVSIGEELGALGLVAVMILLSSIALRALKVSRLSNKNAGKYICVGFFGMIAAQSIINIGMCLSIIPVIGVTLPFFSSGGTSVLCLYLGVGLVLSVYANRNSRTLYLRD